jgi:thioredoxin reductase (NADPH)
MNEWHTFTDGKLLTNMPGIFAAGDFAHFDSKVNLIAGAFTDAVLAVNSAKVHIEPQAARYGYVSSHNDKFKEKNRALGVVVD